MPFQGPGAGVDVLSWGQEELYSAMRRQNYWLPIGMAGPVPAGTSLDDVLAEVRFAMGRYPTMRTRLRHDPDGVTRQVVAERGELTVQVFDTPEGDDPGEFAERIRLRHWSEPHDLTADWPVKVDVVRRHGVPAYVVVVFCHLVTDGFGSIVLYQELTGRDRTAAMPETLMPPTPMPPLEQVAWQRSPAGQRQCAAALAHWERTLRGIQPRRFPETADAPAATGEPRRPRHWEAQFSSPALHLATRALAARTTVDATPLMLAIFAIALARITGIHPVVVQVVVSNRFRPGLAGTVSPVNQTGLCVLDVADTTVDEAIRRTARQALVAYKYAYYDPAALDALVRRLGRERGTDLDIACYLNDRRAFGAGPEPEAAVPTAQAIRDAVAHGEFRWARRQDDPWERLFLHLENVPGTAALTVNADTHYVSPHNIEALLRGMESVAVQAALDPAAVTGVPATPPGPATPPEPATPADRPAPRADAPAQAPAGPRSAP